MIHRSIVHARGCFEAGNNPQRRSGEKEIGAAIPAWAVVIGIVRGLCLQLD